MNCRSAVATSRCEATCEAAKPLMQPRSANQSYAAAMCASFPWISFGGNLMPAYTP